jgi:ABC-type sugar transport system substrate-binding protein
VTTPAPGSPSELVVGMMPKSVLNPYFDDCRKGAEEAARDLGFTLRWSGPTRPDPDRQIQIVKGWIRDALPVIAVSAESATQLSPVLKEARARGLKVLTWDSDADKGARDFTIVQATPESLAQALAFEVGRMLAGQGQVAGITSTMTASNQVAWVDAFKRRLAAEYPGMKLVDVRPCEESQDTARRATVEMLKAHPQVKALVGFCAPAVPGMAEAVKQSARTDVRVTGISPPFLVRSYIEEGVVASVVIWNTRSLGYLAGAAAKALADGSLKPGASSLKAGRLASAVVIGDEIRLGRCHIVSKGNLDKFG